MNTVTPISDLSLYSVDVTLVGFHPVKRWRCCIYFEDALLDSFEVKGGTFDLAQYQAKERAVAIAAGYVDIEPRRPRIVDATSYLEVQGD